MQGSTWRYWPGYGLSESLSPGMLVLTNMRNSPDISAEEYEFEAPLGSFVELVCTANAFPTPTITWFDDDGDVISGDEEVRNITTLIPDETTVTSTLTVTVVNESYYGIYTCEASNEIPPSVQLSMRILEPGGSSAAGIAVTISLVTVGGVAVVIVAVYMYIRSKNKKQYSGNDDER
ncbi:limbic system-associated membrane protein-like [Ptychodera flava]|uniref:limbic system-associated membrane protein-like n=1 Tax=Ptychodera flava TaxID=63121 RepID=UPI00396A56FB